MDEEVVKTEVKVDVRTRGKKGFEDLYDLVVAKLDNLQEEIAREFEARKAYLLEIFDKVAESYEVEIPVESTTEETVAFAEVTV